MDLWSVGCILLELIFGHENFCGHWMSAYDYDNLQNPTLFQDAISTAVRALPEALEDLNREEPLSGELRSFLLQLLQLKSTDRPSAKSLLQQHPWFQSMRSNDHSLAVPPATTPIKGNPSTMLTSTTPPPMLHVGEAETSTRSYPHTIATSTVPVSRLAVGGPPPLMTSSSSTLLHGGGESVLPHAGSQTLLPPLANNPSSRPTSPLGGGGTMSPGRMSPMYLGPLPGSQTTPATTAINPTPGDPAALFGSQMSIKERRLYGEYAHAHPLTGLAETDSMTTEKRSSTPPHNALRKSLALSPRDGTGIATEAAPLSPNNHGNLNLPPILPGTPNVMKARKILRRGDELAQQAAGWEGSHPTTTHSPHPSMP